MMKKTVVAALFALTPLSLAAAPRDTSALRAYVTKALVRCPDAKIDLQPINDPGPTGFLAFHVTQTSSDTACGRRAFVLYSPTSNQVLIGTVIPLPPDSRGIDVRVSETASTLLKQNLTATVAAFPLPDGLRALSLTRETRFGPFSYHGYVDASGQFLIVGMRGNLFIDPGATLVESLGLQNAVRRGNAKAPVKIIELSDFQCPTCARAHKEIEPIIARNLSKIDYARLDLPLFEHHEWALSAALGARAIRKVAPAKYWTYVNFIFENQEVIKEPTFDKTLQNFCEDHDIDWKRVEKIYRSPGERSLLLEQVSRVFDTGVNSTPTYIINGQIMGYGPQGSFTVASIKQAIGAK